MILRDINRTFPAHDYFKESGGVGQDALFKISRAYAVFDPEVSYCQGTSFLSAALLLHVSLSLLHAAHSKGPISELSRRTFRLALYVRRQITTNKNAFDS